MPCTNPDPILGYELKLAGFFFLGCMCGWVVVTHGFHRSKLSQTSNNFCYRFLLLKISEYKRYRKQFILMLGPKNIAHSQKS